MDRSTAKLVNRLTAMLVNCLTATLVNRLTAKLVVVNLVKLHLTELKIEETSEKFANAGSVKKCTYFPRYLHHTNQTGLTGKLDVS